MPAMIHLPSHGSSPSAANETSRPGEAMSRKFVIRASWVPAFTYTSVPSSMPIWLTQ